MPKTKEQKAEYNRQWRLNNPQYSNDWHKNNVERRRDKALKWRYGISLDTYNKMFLSQDGRCAICARHQSELIKTLSVDHCHKTKNVRGLLCDVCNRGIGMLRENPSMLRLAADYLENIK